MVAGTFKKRILGAFWKAFCKQISWLLEKVQTLFLQIKNA
jgi:hypothetical protein